MHTRVSSTTKKFQQGDKSSVHQALLLFLSETSSAALIALLSNSPPSLPLHVLMRSHAVVFYFSSDDTFVVLHVLIPVTIEEFFYMYMYRVLRPDCM